MLIRRHPDLNWGKRICSPPPYPSAMSPNGYKIDEKFPPLSWITELLLFIVLAFWILFSLIPFLKEILLIGFDRLLRLIDCIIYQNTQCRKTAPPLSIEKSNVDFQSQKPNKIEPLTIDCCLWMILGFESQFVYCIPNAIRKYKLI